MKGVPASTAVVLLLALTSPATAPPTTTAVASAPGADRCTVRVRFWHLGQGLHHAYILTSDHGGVTHFRAGPQSPGPLVTRLWSSFGPGRGRRWGPLRAEYGAYEPGTGDYDTGDPPSMTVLDQEGSCGVVNLRLSSAALMVNSAHLTYDPRTTNCNAFVRYALAWLRVSPPAPPVLAPGFESGLPLPVSRVSS